MPTPFRTGYFQVNWMTQGIYDAVKDNLSPYQLYLMQDTNNAYLGTTRLFDMFHLVDSFDEPYRGDAKPNSLCVKLTQGEDGAPLIEAKILQEDYTFTELVPPVMGEIVDEDLIEDRTVPTRRAVWKFVDDRLIALQEYFDALENRVRTMMNRAETAAVNAETSATNADNSATEAESYAHGGTGSRDDENKDNAKYYMEQAREAAEEGGGSSEEARRYAEAAHASEVAAGISETNAATSAIEAEQSATAALNSENAAAASESAAASSESNAASSEANAAASAIAAGESERAAAGSQTAAANSASAAATSETNAAASAQAAAVSETNADASDTSAQLAAQAAEYARNGAVDAKVLAETAQSAAESAATEAADDTADAIEGQFRDDLSALSAAVNSAQSAATVATSSQQSASASAVSAQQSATEAYEYAQQAGLNTVLILDAPPTVNTAAAVGKLAIWHDTENDKNHIYHLVYITTSDSATLYHWEECVLESQRNVAGGFAGLGENGKVSRNNLPVANSGGDYGAVTYSLNYGLKDVTVSGVKYLCLNGASEYGINNRSGAGNGGGRYGAITGANLDYAVRSVLPNVTKIPAATSDYSLVDSSATTLNHSHTFVHTPSQAPTYRLPQVTNMTISHYIELTVDFTNVQTYSFLAANGDALVPLFTPSIAAGDVYTFKMEYSAIKSAWLIYPQKHGAVADDFVMRGEVGAANGVASLDSNGNVPRAELPLGGNSLERAGAVYYGPTNNAYGIVINNGRLELRAADDASIDNRDSTMKPIVPSTLNYAVTAALTDSNKISLNDAQKATAQEVFGVGGFITGTGAPTTSTVGKVMDRYLDTATGKTYTCTAVNVDDTDPQNPATTYTWVDDINANGGTFAKHVHVGNNILLNSYGTLSVGANTYVTGYTGSLAVGSYARALRGSGCTCIGLYAFSTQDSQFVAGKANAQLNGARLTGGGTSNANRRNIEELSWDGDLLIAGGHQQEITNIPSNTTEYALKEGVQRHVPALASVYRLPEVHARCIIAGSSWCRHEDSYDGAGYYGWVTTFSSYPTSWNERVYYTANRYPSATEKAYSNTALTSGKTAITLPPDITHECILTIKFSASVLTYEFQDSAGNTLVPLPLNGDIEAGSVVTFLCRYNPLLAQWVIYPVMDGKEAQE